jgi:hypothetical protein
MEAPPTTFVLLTTGDRLEVAGDAEHVGRILQDAVRSSPGTLAWLPAAAGDEVIGVNPLQVVMVTAAASESPPAD